MLGTHFTDTLEFQDETYHPGEGWDTFVMVEVSTSGYSEDDTPCNWMNGDQIFLTWNNDQDMQEHDWTFCTYHSKSKNVELGFVAHEAGTDWKIHFPEGETLDIDVPYEAAEGRSVSEEIPCQQDNGSEEYLNISVPFTNQSVSIDGQMAPDEWADAVCIDMKHYEWGDIENGNMLEARWWVQNDGSFIYYMVRIPKDDSVKGVAGAYFWPEYTGTWAHSDGFYVNTSGSYQDHSNWDETDWHKDEELSPPGSIDVEAAVFSDNDFNWFEIKKALNSGDGYDWSLKPSQVIGNNPRDTLLFVVVMQDGDYYHSVQMEIGEQ